MVLSLGFRGQSLVWGHGFFFAKGWLYPGLARPLRISYKFLLSVALGSLPLERNKQRKKQTNKEQKTDIDQERNKDRTKEGNEEKKETKKERNKENLA